MLPDFRFHPMYKGQKLTHIIFVDDLIIFYKENMELVNKVIEALTHFSVVAGLEANIEKYIIFLARVDYVYFLLGILVLSYLLENGRNLIVMDWLRRLLKE